LSSQLAFAVYVAEDVSPIDDGPLMERPVKVAAGVELPPPPPPPHVQRIIARKTRSIEAGIYVKKNFLIWGSLLFPFLIGEKGK
jgi:hypothetical protein